MATAPLRRASVAAFTLVELMIALTVGGVAITSIYAVGAASTRQFHQQEQIATAQSSLRIAMSQVKRDLARAGYLATPIADAPTNYVPQSCGPASSTFHAPSTTGSLAAISRFVDNVTVNTANNNLAVDPTGSNLQNGFTADEIVLFGNYETSAEYPGITLIGSNVISIDQNWQSFQRDFTDWSNGNAGVVSNAAFNSAFAVGRLIRIQTTRRVRHFAQITAVTIPTTAGQDPTITFTPAIPGGCLADVNGGWVAPVSAIRYLVQNAPTGEDERIVNTTGPMAQLLRREVQPANKTTPLATNVGNTRAVLDYVVGFNLAFTVSNLTAPGMPDNYIPATLGSELSDNITNTGTSVASLINSNPERVRAVSIELAVRAPEQDATLPWSQTTCANMQCFQVFPTSGANARQGSSRVRRMRADVFLPNVAYEGY